jgi:hypothetical protein
MSGTPFQGVVLVIFPPLWVTSLQCTKCSLALVETESNRVITVSFLVCLLLLGRREALRDRWWDPSNLRNVG